MFPTQKLKGDKLIEVVAKIKEGMKTKCLNVAETFKKLDVQSTGLLSFATFATEIDKVAPLSQFAKERLFASMDSMAVGLVSFAQFNALMTKSNIKLRDEDGSA